MTDESAFQKRLKRHIIGRVRDYFAATAPGLESLCREELLALPLSVRETRVVTGGVEFKGRLADCYLANLHLRCANRILMRIDCFKATGFGQLQRKLAQVPWELFLWPGTPPAVTVTTRHCRLHHGGAIEARVLEAVDRCLSVTAPVPGAGGDVPIQQRIFIRGVDDRFTVSLDSSGENLYKRGIKTHGGRAPLRETMAAAILKTAGYSVGEPLIDPMCGAGTFSLEAAMLHLNLPAGWFRDFAFTTWPSFQSKRWHYIRRECKKRFATVSQPVIFASDRNRQACRRLGTTVRAAGFSRAVAVSNADFFDLSPADLTPAAGLVVLNPPYGRRLGGRSEGEKTMVRIGKRLRSAYRGWKFALITPHPKAVEKMLQPCQTMRLFHGGLKLTLLTGRIS